MTSPNVAPPYPWDYDLNNLESTRPNEDASTQDDFYIFFSIYYYVKINPPLWPQPTPGDHDFNKLELTLPEDASTQI